MMNSLRSKFKISYLKTEDVTPLRGFLHESLGLSDIRFDELMNLGCIYHNEKRLNVQSAPANLSAGDTLRVHQDPRRFRKDLFSYPECQIFEHPDFIIINKPSGLPVPPTVDNAQENLVKLLSESRKEQLHVTHRLDIATSGLMFFARSKTSQRLFNDLLVNRALKKLYRAIVTGEYSGEKLLTHYMEPSPKAPKNVTREPKDGWLECQLKIISSRYDKISSQSELLIELLTGRTHQIRAQLSYEGHPILGDHLYGSSIRLAHDHELIRLESSFLSFNWKNEEFKFELPPGGIK